MGSYGMQMFRDDGTVSWDSSAVKGGVVIDTIFLTPTQSYNKSYTEFPGRVIRIIHIYGYYGFDSINISTTTVNGYPEISAGPNNNNRNFLVVVY